MNIIHRSVFFSNVFNIIFSGTLSCCELSNPTTAEKKILIQDLGSIYTSLPICSCFGACQNMSCSSFFLARTQRCLQDLYHTYSQDWCNTFPAPHHNFFNMQHIQSMRKYPGLVFWQQFKITIEIWDLLSMLLKTHHLIQSDIMPLLLGSFSSC